MQDQRIFHSHRYFTPAPGEPVRTVVTQAADAVVVAWHVAPGQSIRAHVHPSGQDTWTVLSGSGRYFLSADGSTLPISAGDVAVAPAGAVHGVINDGAGDLTIISVVTPREAGYQLV
jgi:quercetin dioxygenase-like cupin family protein